MTLKKLSIITVLLNFSLSAVNRPEKVFINKIHNNTDKIIIVTSNIQYDTHGQKFGSEEPDLSLIKRFELIMPYETKAVNKPIPTPRLVPNWWPLYIGTPENHSKLFFLTSYNNDEKTIKFELFKPQLAQKIHHKHYKRLKKSNFPPEYGQKNIREILIDLTIDGENLEKSNFELVTAIEG